MFSNTTQLEFRKEYPYKKCVRSSYCIYIHQFPPENVQELYIWCVFPVWNAQLYTFMYNYFHSSREN